MDKTDRIFENAMSFLPIDAEKAIRELNISTVVITEIRIRSDKYISFTACGKQIKSGFFTDKKTVEQIFLRLCDNSVFTHQQDINNGFITADGGLRIGVCGTAVVSDGKIANITEITGLNIRIARHIDFAAKEIIKEVLHDKKVKNTLIIGPPLSGKTTVLRDIIVRLSNENLKLSVIDERKELCIIENAAQNVDFFKGYPRKSGIEQAIRCFSPNVIIFDELGNESDIEGLNMAVNTGVSIITTAHAEGLDELSKRKGFKDIFEEGIFKLCISLDVNENIGKIKEIIRL